MKFTKKQMLNISTGVLHTNMEDIYMFFNEISPGIFTHMLPNALRSIQPIFHRKFPELPKEGYFPKIDKKVYEFEFTEEEKKEFWELFKNLPDPLTGKKVIVVNT